MYLSVCVPFGLGLLKRSFHCQSNSYWPPLFCFMLWLLPCSFSTGLKDTLWGWSRESIFPFESGSLLYSSLIYIMAFWILFTALESSTLFLGSSLGNSRKIIPLWQSLFHSFQLCWYLIENYLGSFMRFSFWYSSCYVFESYFYHCLIFHAKVINISVQTFWVSCGKKLSHSCIEAEKSPPLPLIL